MIRGGGLVGGPALVRWFNALSLAVLLLLPARAWAATPTQIPNYKHTTLTSDQGAPSPVYDIAQTSDGYLWIAAQYGLWRYDGIEFERVALPEWLPRRSTQVDRLFADREGGLWIGHDWGGMTLYKNGSFRNMNLSPKPGQPRRFFEDARGRIWVLCSGAFGSHLWRYDHGRAESLTDRVNFHGQIGMDMLLGRDGSIWIALEKGIAYLRSGDARFSVVKAQITDLPRLGEGTDGSIWIADKARLRQVWSGSFKERPFVTQPILRFDGSGEDMPLTRDQFGVVWLGSTGAGVFQIRGLGKYPTKIAVERFPGEALSSSTVRSVFVDRESNIWVGTNLGLDKFRPTSISKIFGRNKDAPSSYGFNSGFSPISNGSLLVNTGNSLYRVGKSGRLIRLIKHEVHATSICTDSDGGVWLRTQGHLTRLADGKDVPVPSYPDTEYLGTCLLGKNGWWITTLVSLYHADSGGSAWASRVLDPAFDGAPVLLASDYTGSVLANFGNWATFRVSPHGTQLFWPRESPLKFVNFFTTVGDDVFIGGARGIARFGRHGLQILLHDSYPELDEVSGLAVRPNGKAWIAARNGILSVDARSLYAAFDSPGRPLRFHEYGSQDGLEAAASIDFKNTLALDALGRLWIATLNGIYMLDESRAAPNRLMPPVVIQTLTANGKAWPVTNDVRLSRGTSQILINYTAPSLRDPQHVIFRYRLKGHDTDWTEAGTRRQAIYTDLAPGSYTFEVKAANENGVWNNRGASLSIDIPPTFLQSRLFRVLCCAAVLLVAVVSYRLRLRQIASRIEARFMERTSERERIARELHDTLLQGVQGLILGLQNVADDLHSNAPARAEITRSLDRADDLLAESRDRVHDLRTSTQARSLPEALILLGERTLAGTGVDIRSAVTGEERDLRPLVADELIRLSEEAFFNVHRHAHATRVTIGITFGKRHFSLRLDDDGVGMSDEHAVEGLNGHHFGLTGMRERVLRISGKFLIFSRVGAGTSVQVTLPAHAAYAEERQIVLASQRLRQWFRSSASTVSPAVQRQP